MGLAATLSGLALVIACASIVIAYLKSPPETLRRVTAIEVDLQEAMDSMSRWMKRENVRRARDAKEDNPPPQSVPIGVLDSHRNKAQLRERARAKGLM